MRLRHIEVFYEVYRTGAITKAAEQLNVSQPSVSKVLQHAEMQLGFKLFKRVKGKLIATPEAEALIVDVSKIYAQIGSLRKSARNLRENAVGKISLSVVPALGLNILPRAIKHFHDKHPHVSFNVQTKHHDEVAESLAEFEIDIGFIFDSETSDSDLDVEIGSGELVCMHPAGFFEDKAKIEIEELIGHNFISIIDSGPLGALVEEKLLSSGINLDSRIQAQTYYIAKNLVAHGLGISIVDEFTAQAADDTNLQATGFVNPIKFSVRACVHLDHPVSNVCLEFLDSFYEVFESHKQP